MTNGRTGIAPMLERLWLDVRHGWRVFAKAPAFSAVAVISIAFGTGANVAIFSAVDALLLRPPRVERPGELITIGSRVDRGLGTAVRMSHADYLDVRARSQSFSGLFATTSRWVGFATMPRSPARIKVATLVSANFFQVLGVEPALGRTFRANEDSLPGRDAVVMLSHAIWRNEFGGSPDVVGRTIRLAGIDFAIVGVTPESFTGIDAFTRDDVYLPLAMWHRVAGLTTAGPLDDRGARLLTVKGRLAPGVAAATARAELSAIAGNLARAYPATNRRQAIEMQTELQMRLERRPVDTQVLALLSILSLAVLCVACANVAGLLVSRAPARTKEIAVRLSIGASRGRLVTQLVSESLAIAAVGGVGGLVVGYAGILILRQIDFATEVFSYPVMEIDRRTLAFSVGTAIASVVAFGVSPALQAARLDLAAAMKSTDTGRKAHGPMRGRNALVAAQVAVSLVVLTVAAFVFQIFTRELTSGPGFRVANMAMASLDAAQARYGRAEWAGFFERVAERARRLPGARSATVASEMPLWGLELSSMVPDGYRLADGQTGLRLYASSVHEDYFDTLDIPIVAGRTFRVTDDAAAPRVAIVNETLARHYWPGGNAIGGRFRVKDDRGPWVEVVGVARNSSYIYTGEPPFEVAYFPFRQEPRGSMVLLVQSAGASAGVLGPIREMVRGMDADVPVFNLQTVEHFYDARATFLGRITVSLIGGMGVMGLALAMVGLYGLVSYAVGRRTREIGVRIAVGASPAHVLAMVLREGTRPAWVGMAAGLLLSIVTARLLPALVPIGPRYDAATVFVCLPLLLAVTAIAAGVPARRAARVDPTVALRSE